MKNKTKILAFLFLTILLFSSCKDFNKEVLSDDSIPVESVEKPSIEKIENDLLGNKIDTWTFDKLEEFNSVNITNSKILDDLNLEIEVSLDLTGYGSGNKFKGNIVVSYSRMANNSSSWEFKEVNGTVYKAEKEPSDENSDSNQTQNEEEKNDYPICDRCGNEIRSRTYYLNFSGSEYYIDEEYTSLGGPYHQNCAEEEADYKNRNRNN